MLSQFLCNKAGVIELAKGLCGFQKDLHAFRKTEKIAFKFPKVNASGKEGRKSLPLFSTGKSKLLIFILYFSLHNKAASTNWAKYFLLSFSSVQSESSFTQFDGVNLVKPKNNQKLCTCCFRSGNSLSISLFSKNSDKSNWNYLPLGHSEHTLEGSFCCC